MQIGRINVFPTTTLIASISPPEGTAVCGDLIIFTVHVDGYVAPDGYVIIQDVQDGYIVGHGTLSPISGTASQAIISTPLPNGPGHYVAFYPYPYVLQSQVDIGAGNEIVSSFGKSQSAVSLYDVGFGITTTTIDPTIAESYFCYHQDFVVFADVTLGGSPVIDGYVEFRLFHQDGYTVDNLGVGQLDMSGSASAIIPASSTIPFDDYYIQAIYLGSGCFGSSNSPGSIDGTRIHSVRLDATTTAVPAWLPASPPHSLSGPVMFTTTVTATNLPSFAVGYVEFFGASLGPSVALGTSYLAAGATPQTAVVPSTVIAPASGSGPGQILPQSIIHVGSTDGFAASGTMYISTSAGTQAITYTGIVGGMDPQFTGCVDGAPPGTLITTAGDVCAFAVPAGTFTAADWTIHATYNSDGYCYAGSVGSSGVFTIDP